MVIAKVITGCYIYAANPMFLLHDAAPDTCLYLLIARMAYQANTHKQPKVNIIFYQTFMRPSLPLH